MGKNKPNPQSPATTRPAPLKGLEYVPPVGQEDRPPLFVNTVVVTGGADAVVLTLYHVSPNTLTRVFRPGVSKWAHVEHGSDVTTVRTEPVARVAIPLTVALDTVIEMFATIIQGIPDIQAAAATMGERIAEIMVQAQRMGKTGESDTAAGPGSAGNEPKQ